MIVCKFTVKNQRLIRSNYMFVPFASYGLLKCEFKFITDDWKDIEEKTANFFYKNTNYPVVLDKNNQCYVPKEVIFSPHFKVSIFGGDIVTNCIKVYVEDTKSNPGGILPPSETLPITNKVFVPSISEDKILSWTISDSNGDMTPPDPVDLNPFDEWSNDGDIASEYEWEEE